MKTAVIYARYSSDNQSEQSIRTAPRMKGEYAWEVHDILILDTYIDRAMTGTNDTEPIFSAWSRIAVNANGITCLSIN